MKDRIWAKFTLRRPLLTLVYGIIFVLTIIGSSLLFNILFPYPSIPKNLGDVSYKLEYFAKHKNEYNTIFIGPSTTYYHVIPTLFDDSISEIGTNIKSFNMGMGGMSLLELNLYIKKIFAMKPTNLKWVFVDYSPSVKVRWNNHSYREIYSHDIYRTLTVCRLIIESDRNILKKISLIIDHLKPFLYRSLLIGRFSNEWRSELLDKGQLLDEGRSLREISQKFIGQEGYVALEDQRQKYCYRDGYGMMQVKSYQKYLATLATYNQTLETFKQTKVKSAVIKPLMKRFLLEIVEEIRQHHAEPIFFISPIMWNLGELIKLYEQGNIPILFPFNDPETFPSLYDPDIKCDYVHMNDRGAKEFTRILASRFADHLKEKEQR